MLNIHKHKSILVKKNILITATLVMSLSACTKLDVKTVSILKESPIASTTNMSSLLHCVSNNLNEYYQKNGAYNINKNRKGLKKYLVVIRPSEFSDGTVRGRAASDGKLADDSAKQLKAIVNKWFPANTLVLPAREIPLFRQFGVKGSAMTEYGTIPSTLIKSLYQSYGVNNIVSLAGSFTKLDSSPIYDDGKGSFIGSRGNSGDFGLNRGQASQSSLVGLSATLGHIQTNRAVSSIVIESRYHRDSKEVKFRMSLGEGSLSMNRKVVSAEGLHSAQQTLLEATVLWLVNSLYPVETKSQRCFEDAYNADPEKIKLKQKQWIKTKKEDERLRLIQDELIDAGFLEKKQRSGKLDRETLQAIRKYEFSKGMTHTPHTYESLDDLYLQMQILKKKKKGSDEKVKADK